MSTNALVWDTQEDERTGEHGAERRDQNDRLLQVRGRQAEVAELGRGLAAEDATW